MTPGSGGAGCQGRLRLARFVAALIIAACLPAQAQDAAALVGSWAIHRAEPGGTPGFEYDSVRWVRRHAADGSGTMEVYFYRDGKRLFGHREEGRWGVSPGTYWFQCARITRRGETSPCERRGEYAVLQLDATTFRYRAAGSEFEHTLTRVADDFQLP